MLRHTTRGSCDGVRKVQLNTVVSEVSIVMFACLYRGKASKPRLKRLPDRHPFALMVHCNNGLEAVPSSFP